MLLWILDTVPVKGVPLRNTVPVKGVPLRYKVPINVVSWRNTVPVKGVPLRNTVPVKGVPLRNTVTVKGVPLRNTVPVKGVPLGNTVPVKGELLRNTVPVKGVLLGNTVHVKGFFWGILSQLKYVILMITVPTEGKGFNIPERDADQYLVSSQLYLNMLLYTYTSVSYSPTSLLNFNNKNPFNCQNRKKALINVSFHSISLIETGANTNYLFVLLIIIIIINFIYRG